MLMDDDEAGGEKRDQTCGNWAKTAGEDQGKSKYHSHDMFGGVGGGGGLIDDKWLDWAGGEQWEGG